VSSTPGSTVEPSAVQGILSERFCCGPDLTFEQQQDPYYSSDLGQVFFPPNCWPTDSVPQLQPQMLRCYSQCEVIAASLMQLLAVALGVPQHYFDDKLLRHHSNMQASGSHGHRRVTR
jgi:isopenicillin N synthase-like dioxygenase